MKKLLLFCLLFLCMPLAFADTATYVTGCVGNTSGTGQTIACTYPSSQAVGTLLVGSLKKDDTANDTLSFTVTVTGATATCVQIGTVQVQAGLFATGYFACLVTGAGIPVVSNTWTGGTTDAFLTISSGSYTAPSGFASSTADAFVGSPNVTSTACTAGPTAATTTANELVVFICDNWNAAQTYGTTPTGYSANRSTSSRNTTGWFDKTVTTTGTQSGSATIVSDVSIGAVFTFPINSGGGGTIATPGRGIIF